MATETAEDLVATYGTTRTMHYVEALPYQKNVRNPAGWLRRAIVDGYDLGLPGPAAADVTARGVGFDETKTEVADSEGWISPKPRGEQLDEQENVSVAARAAKGHSRLRECYGGGRLLCLRRASL